MENIAKIVQIDGKLPNLALMQLSSWLKSIGWTVHFTRETQKKPGEPTYDIVLASSIFKFSSDKISRLLDAYPTAIVGGTGSDSNMTADAFIGRMWRGKDYSLYPGFDASMGFTQRGCRLSCKFCVVPTKEGKPSSVATIHEIWRGPGHPKKIHLLDNDFFGQSEDQWQARIAEIKDGGFKVCLNQGINVRHLSYAAAQALAGIEYRDDQFRRRRLYTAWDNLKDEKIFFNGINMLEDAGVNPKNIMAYMLVGFAKGETLDAIFHRFYKMVDRGILPFPMVFDCRETDPNRYRELKQFQRWAVTGLYRVIPWCLYDPKAKSRRAA